jgi:hypothetical protein
LAIYPNRPECYSELCQKIAALLSGTSFFPTIQFQPGTHFCTMNLSSSAASQLFAANGSIVLSSGQAVLFSHFVPERPPQVSIDASGVVDLRTVGGNITNNLTTHCFFLFHLAIYSRQQNRPVLEIVYPQDSASVALSHWQTCCFERFFPGLRKLSFSLESPVLGSSEIAIVSIVAPAPAPIAGLGTIGEVLHFFGQPNGQWEKLYRSDAVLSIGTEKVAQGPAAIGSLLLATFPEGFHVIEARPPDISETDAGCLVVMTGRIQFCGYCFVRSFVFAVAHPPFIILNDHVFLYQLNF